MAALVDRPAPLMFIPHYINQPIEFDKQAGVGIQFITQFPSQILLQIIHHSGLQKKVSLTSQQAPVKPIMTQPTE